MGYFPLHVGDWFASETVGLLTRAGEAGYLRLLLHQWKNEDDGLPGDPAKLRVLAGLTVAEWKAAWPILADAFPLDQDGRRRNPRLVHERAYMLAQREKARTRASKGGAAKAAADAAAKAAAKQGGGTGGASPKQRPTAAQAVLKQSASTPEALPEQCLSMPPHPHPVTTNSESQEAPLEVESAAQRAVCARAPEPPPAPVWSPTEGPGPRTPSPREPQRARSVAPIGALVGGLLA